MTAIGTVPLDAAVDRVRAVRSRQRRRVTLVTSALLALVIVLFFTFLMVGSYVVAPWDAAASILRIGDKQIVDFIVRDLRLPTATAAVAVGVALGIAGMVFQNLLGNPLASPDFVGVTAGASLFAVAGIAMFNFTSTQISGAALVGALGSATLIYLLAWRGGVSGYRFILIGIGVSEFMMSIVAYILARAELFDARQGFTWLTGSAAQGGPGELRALLVALAVLIPAALMLERALRSLELGDDTARALGSRVELQRLALLAISVVLVGFSTAVAGPIMFVALVAGPIARRLIGTGSGGILAAGFVGAAIVLGSDLVARYLLPTALPTGVVTGLVGAPYLIYLLATVNREGRGG